MSNPPYWIIVGLFAFAYAASEVAWLYKLKRKCPRLFMFMWAITAVIILILRADKDVFSFFAEMMVAWVIYREIELTRRERFIDVIDRDATVEARANLYDAFGKFLAKDAQATNDSAARARLGEEQAVAETAHDATGEPTTQGFFRHPEPRGTNSASITVEKQHLVAFAAEIDASKELRRDADAIVRSFGHAGLFGPDWMPSLWFPHGATLCGILLQEYVKLRQSQRDPNWGRNFLALARKASAETGPNWGEAHRFDGLKVNLTQALAILRGREETCTRLMARLPQTLRTKLAFHARSLANCLEKRQERGK